MASLLERMDVTPTDGGAGAAGPVRNRGGRAGAPLPYVCTFSCDVHATSTLMINLQQLYLGPE